MWWWALLFVALVAAWAMVPAIPGPSTRPKPLIVLAADTGHDDKWQSKQDHLATLSTNSPHRIAKATTHESLIDDEADSAAASQAIHGVVAAVRSSQPLASR